MRLPDWSIGLSALLIVALLPACRADVQAPLSLPAPVEWAAPAGAPAAPGDGYGVVFADPSGSVGPNAPVIGEWNRTAKPGESFTLTGIRLTSRTGADAGTDTTVWIWGDTPSGGKLTQARIWRVSQYSVTAMIPADLPFGMYMVWVENENGASAPVCINRVETRWIGPLGNAVVAGDKRRVFGKNISYGHGSATSYAYMQPSGGGAFTALTVSRVEPYDVEFTVPAGTPNGNYKIYVHSGHGGQYGWGDPLDLTVQGPWVRGTYQINLTPAVGGDDTSALQAAINSVSVQPNGGTVSLSAGTFTATDQVWIKDKVRLVGAGMDSTTLQIRPQVQKPSLVYFSGNHVSVEDVNIRQCLTPYNLIYTFFSSGLPGVQDIPLIEDTSIIRTRVSCETGVRVMRCWLDGTRVEWANCELYGTSGPGRFDGWMHDCTLYGAPYSDNGESAATGTGRAVFERNYVTTPHWPYDPNQTHPYNYTEWMTNDQIAILQWARRVWLANQLSQGWSKDQYLAWTTTKDVAVQDNRGEMFLFHGGGGAWCGQCLSTTGNTTTVRTDGLVDGQAFVLANYSDQSQFHITAGSPVPDSYSYGFPINGGLSDSEPICMVIIAGAGMGQSRQILTHTSNTITVQKPWRIPPDSTSKAVLTPQYTDVIVYRNDLNAFPPGYVQGYSASIGVDIDGNGWGIDVEGNTSHRTNGGRNIIANSIGVSYWCTMRDENTFDANTGGHSIFTWEANPGGFTNIGDMIHGGSTTAVGVTPGTMLGANEETQVIEGVTGTGGTPGIYASKESVFRNNVLNVDQIGGSQGVYLYTTDANPILLGNTYTGATSTYAAIAGCTFAQKPLPEFRVARFKGSVGAAVGDVAIPIADAGIQTMNWTATPSDPWIIANVPSGPSLAAESEMGRLVIGVNTSGMTAGRHWGYVDINTGGPAARIGVCVDLSASAGNASPIASFTSSAISGTAPLAVDFNASASYDPGGVIKNYAWDFGDGTYGTGVTASHTYPNAGTYAPVVTVTDDSGATDVAYATITVAPALTGIALSGSPNPPVPAGTSITLTATASGGYQVQYKFLVNPGSGWQTLADYQSGNTCVWTPSQNGYYSLKVYARNAVSTAAYDIASAEIGYPVGLVPADGLRLWLRGDAGTTYDSGLKMSAWTDQSSVGNNFSQSVPAYRPVFVPDSGNGRPAARFGNPNMMMTCTNRVITGNTEFTCIGLVKYNGAGTPSGNQYLFWDGTDPSNNYGGYGIWLDAFGRLNAAWSQQTAKIYDTAVMAGGQWYIFTTKYGGGSHQMWVNGISKGTVAKTNSNITTGSTSVGNKGPASYQSFDGDMLEMLVYNRVLTDTERTSVESYLAARYQPQSVTSLAAARLLPDGSTVNLTVAKAATVSSGTFADTSYYLEEPDRFAGMKVVGGAGLSAVSLWDRITLNGIVGTDVNGEKMLFISRINSQAAGDPVNPVGMLGKNLVPGMLVTVCGKVTVKTDTYFSLDDGSGSVVRVPVDGLTTPIATTPNMGDYVSVIGPAGFASGGARAVRPRSAADIRVY